MREWFQRFYCHGTGGACEAQRARIQVGNLLAATACVVTLAFGFAHLTLGHAWVFVGNLVVSWVYASYFALQARGRRELGARVVTAVFLLHITALGLLFGREFGFHHYYALAAPIALVLLPSERPRVCTAVIASSMLLYLGFAIVDRAPLLTLADDAGHRVLALSSVPVIVGVLLLVLGDFLRQIHARALALERAARTDPLTTLANRRHGFEHARATFEQARRSGEAMAVLMLDIDHFKRINDRHGHPTGDVVLRMVARALSERLRLQDLVCRWGGEEFMVILSTTDAPCNPLVVAQSLVDRVAAIDLRIDGHTIACTASVGVATLTHRDTTLEALLARADRALYDAKARGRNRAVMDAAPALVMTLSRGGRCLGGQDVFEQPARV